MVNLSNCELQECIDTNSLLQYFHVQLNCIPKPTFNFNNRAIVDLRPHFLVDVIENLREFLTAGFYV